jgi:hypothetical protein
VIQNIVLDVWLPGFGGENIAADGIVPQAPKRIANDAGVLTRNQNT